MHIAWEKHENKHASIIYLHEHKKLGPQARMDYLILILQLYQNT